MARTVLNALGETLYYSDTSTGFFSATGSGPLLTGTAGNDSMWGDSSVNVTMAGGTGDDIYYLYSSINRAVENAGEGIDTIDTWMSYTLPDNFENLRVTGDGRYAFGNELDNIITGGSGSQTIDGGAGNDVLIGGGGADTFVFTSGNGTDLIMDFSANDTIRLNGYGITSFEQLVSNATQQGDNLWLNFANGEAVVLAGTTIDDLQADQFEAQPRPIIPHPDLCRRIRCTFTSQRRSGDLGCQILVGTGKGKLADDEWRGAMVHQPRLCRHIRGQSLQHQQRCPDYHRRGNPAIDRQRG